MYTFRQVKINQWCITSDIRYVVVYVLLKAKCHTACMMLQQWCITFDMLLFMCCYEAKCHTACMMLQVAGPTSTAAGSLREGLGHLTTQGRCRHLYGRPHTGC